MSMQPFCSLESTLISYFTGGSTLAARASFFCYTANLAFLHFTAKSEYSFYHKHESQYVFESVNAPSLAYYPFLQLNWNPLYTTLYMY